MYHTCSENVFFGVLAGGLAAAFDKRLIFRIHLFVCDWLFLGKFIHEADVTEKKRDYRVYSYEISMINSNKNIIQNKKKIKINFKKID